MKIAITGGTGFVGRHLARELVARGHEVVLIARGLDDRDQEIRQLQNATFSAIGIDDENKLAEAFLGVEAVAHCAGINRQVNVGDYQTIHVEGTRKVVNAAKTSGVKKIVILSFLRARPQCGSQYHETKFAAEEIIRSSGLDFTVIKSGMIYGRGDHMLDHLSHALHTLPLFGTVGFQEKPICPVAIEDMVRILVAALIEDRLSGMTVAVTGPELIPLSEAVRRVGRVIGRSPMIVPLPIAFHRTMAAVLEKVMKIPLVSQAQVQMLVEGFSESAPPCQTLPEELRPTIMFTEDQIRKGLPAAGGFGPSDCR